MKTWHMVAAVGLGTLLAWSVARGRQLAAQRHIVNQVVDLIQECKAKEKAGGLGVIPTNGAMPQQPPDPDIYIDGKVLVWEMASDTRSRVNDLLPVELRATSRDRPITVFMLMGPKEHVVGRYTQSAQSAYLSFTGVAVASWPNKKVIGYYSIPSTMPRTTRVAVARPEHGDRNSPIAAWIRSLPRAEPPRAPQEPDRAPPPGQAPAGGRAGDDGAGAANGA